MIGYFYYTDFLIVIGGLFSIPFGAAHLDVYYEQIKNSDVWNVYFWMTYKMYFKTNVRVCVVYFNILSRMQKINHLIVLQK